MERLTEWSKNGYAVVAGTAAGATPTEVVFMLPSILDRLAAYEDTGVTPEEIAALKAERDAEKNEPLTLDELRMMDGQPVYVTQPGHESSWALVYGFWPSKGIIYLTHFNGATDLVEILLRRGAKIYRRHPKEASRA